MSVKFIRTHTLAFRINQRKRTHKKRVPRPHQNEKTNRNKSSLFISFPPFSTVHTQMTITKRKTPLPTHLLRDRSLYILYLNFNCSCCCLTSFQFDLPNRFRKSYVCVLDFLISFFFFGADVDPEVCLGISTLHVKIFCKIFTSLIQINLLTLEQ